MRADHANLLQFLGVVVIEDSPVVKFPIPGRGSILNKVSDPEPKPADPETTPESPNENIPLEPEEKVEGTEDQPNAEPSAVPEQKVESDAAPKATNGSQKNRKQRAERKNNETAIED